MTSMLEIFRKELELCKVGSGQTLAVLTEDGHRQDYANAFLAAAQELGASAFQINLTRSGQGGRGDRAVGATSLAGNRPAIEALKSADIVIDLMFLLFSEEQIEITDSGTRMLLVVEPFEVLSELLPNETLRKRVEAGGERLKNARTMRITSPAGTDVTYELGKYPTLTEYGYTDEPGRWDHWPSGFLFTQGNDEGVNGTVVIGTGDIIFPLKRYVVDPITLTIEKSMVTKISGDGLDAAIMRDYMESYKDPRAYAISHIGWGLNELARWSQLATSANIGEEIGMHGRAFYGNVLFSTGPNTELGGTNDTMCHLDIPLKGASLWLDGDHIVDLGKIVPKEMQPA
ncbi:leucyl aminopeptidase [Acuticoccus kandeliae]|uniref:leucyl aminopeptidase n=1 Tax=Acuticoccus kandeliae TaxID=2073160 RepID=UPI000D3E0810|nr:leucyl aminopeptidase [Acuticoccus kandeliae]